MIPISLIIAGIILIIFGYALTQVKVYYTEEQRKIIADRMEQELTILSCPSRETCQPPLYYNPYTSLGQGVIGFGVILIVLGGIMAAREKKKLSPS